jgi:hypothetical protein
LQPASAPALEVSTHGTHWEDAPLHTPVSHGVPAATGALSHEPEVQASMVHWLLSSHAAAALHSAQVLRSASCGGSGRQNGAVTGQPRSASGPLPVLEFRHGWHAAASVPEPWQ